MRRAICGRFHDVRGHGPTFQTVIRQRTELSLWLWSPEPTLSGYRRAVGRLPGPDGTQLIFG